jgi:hypothetical protein
MFKPPSEVKRTLDLYRSRLFLREADQMFEMADRWLNVEHAIEGRIAALVQQAADLRATGKTVNYERVIEMDHYRALLAQAQQETTRYTDWSSKRIAGEQEAYTGIGIDSARDTIRASYLDAGKVIAHFDILPVEAIDTMIGYAGDGTPLNKLLVKSYPETILKLTQSLIDGTAKGINPRDTARSMADDMAGNLQRALVIARTEQIRSFKTASRQQMIASNVVGGWIWKCALSDRTCLGCLAMDGTEHALGEDLNDHPNGRCFQQPMIEGLTPVASESGEDWFTTQSDTTQLEIMGPDKYSAWKEGKINFADLVTVKTDQTWGGTIAQTSLDELLSGTN